ncbi:hypothetical protein AMS68_005546 [Peltaster fructicola]|uniref:Cytochrome P450 n=1 Tax=Peltaster fructicola TaxID=286661 RepID=A0A6H0XZJ0_9PEZI|nr:hypothetical protein AMS68_005546 [Peltaster fructicola]
MAIASLLQDTSLTTLASFVALTAITAWITFLLHRAFFHPLAAIPGPLICRFTSLWIWYHTYIGDDCSIIDLLHKKYGPVLRIGPNDCVIADGAALAPIYSEKGGFLKAGCYSNFDLEGHATIFSALDTEYRAKRSKAVTSLFSTNNIRAKHDVFEAQVERFIARLKSEASTGNPVNMLVLCRRLALDSVCSYLFQRPYGGIDESGDKLSAAIFVDTAVAFGRFFFLPNWLFQLVELTRQNYFASKAESTGINTVDVYGHGLSANATDESTFQGRLKSVGLTDHEIEVQCKDLIFAGTDSTGTVMSLTSWHLCNNPDVYKKLKDEIVEADANDPTGAYNPQSLKYLDAVIKEGLRLGRANPTRFPRVVPLAGWTFSASNGKIYHFPAGTIVGCAPMTLHENPDIFVQPKRFNPDRWLDGPKPEMLRDLIPFNIGSRQCIARNMAQYELLLAVRALARHDVFAGAKPVADRIRIIEWFNSRIVSEKVELVWS